MGSVKKKLTKTLRKITPKEIAPILPFIAMALPGIGGIASNALLRYGLPQLLTAAGSARTSGKINPLNQALAAFASYSAAPGMEGTTGMGTADKLTTKEINFLDSQGGKDFLAANPSYVNNPDLLSMGAGTTPSTYSQTLLSDPKFAQAVKSSGSKGSIGDLFTGATRMVGDPIRDLGAGNFNFKNLATVGGLGGTAVGSDYAAKALAEAEAENERLSGLYGSYGDSVTDFIKAFGNIESDPYALYKGTSLFAAKGGLVPPQRGPMPQGMNKGGRVGFAEGDVVTPGVKNEGILGLLEMIFGKPEDPGNIEGEKELLEKLKAEESQMTPDDVTSDLGKFFRSEFLGANQYDHGPTDVMGSSQMMPMTDEEYSLSRDGFAVDPEKMKELGIDGLLKRILSGSGTRSLINAFTGGDMNREKLGKGDMNMGGRVGLNMGGMGSIPQTPMVPQGMQLNGQGGGFIPMGAQEKKDDVPAMLAKNEFVMTSDAVKAAGGGSVNKGAQRMYDLMNKLEAQV